MGRYKTRDIDEHGELILVPEILDPVMTDGESPGCNFCVFHESRVDGRVITDIIPGRCGSMEPGGCRQDKDDVIFIYRHELKTYRARALVAKINRAGVEEC